MRIPMAIRFLTLFLMGMAALPALGATRLEIEGVKGDLLDNVRTFVGLPVDDDPLVIRRHSEGVAKKSRSALEALGYYDATIQVSTHGEKEDTIIQVVIDPGEPIYLDTVSIHLEGAATHDPAFTELIRQLPLKEGDVLNHGTYEKAKRDIENLALSHGYFDGVFTTNEIQIHLQQHEADILLTYNSGCRYHLGSVHFSSIPLSPALLKRLIPFKEGDPYSADQVSKLHLNLLNSGYFQEVRIQPQPEKAGKDDQIPIEAKLEMSQRNRVSLGLGATTDEGPRIRLGWERPWINHYGHFSSFNGTWSLVRQEVTAQYTIPLNPPLTHQLQFMTGWEREEVEDTDRDTFSAGIQRWRLFPSKWEQTLFLRWEYENFTQANVEDQSKLTLPGISLSRTRRSSEVNPTHGDRIFGLIEGAHPDFFSDIALGRMLLQAKRLDSWGNHRLSGRIEYGAINTEDFDRTPSSLRFFAGGDQSVRGFAYQSLSPKNEEGELIGGSYLLTGSLEYNYQLTAKWRVGTFFDIGNAFADHTLSGGFAQGTGVGVQWISPIAPIKLDFAWGISESPAPFRVHLSMGFAI